MDGRSGLVRSVSPSTCVDVEARREQLRYSLEKVRERTLWLLDMVPDEFLKVRVHNFYSPIGWHFGHVGRTEEYWICHKAMGKEVIDDHLSFLFADLPENPKDNRVNLPSREQIVEYLVRTRAGSLDALSSADLSSENAFLADGYAWDFALQHECQHQETICEMLQLIQQAQLGEPTCATQQYTAVESEAEWVRVPGGVFTMGWNNVCSYDNEKAEHEVAVAPFELQRTQVTARDWLAFMADGGYLRRELWNGEGWAWRCANDVETPEYWHVLDGAYLFVGPKGLRAIDPMEPVSSISWYEADAYARWIGARLPTEDEWEYAARFDPATGESRFFPWGTESPDELRAVSAMHNWGARPVGERSAGDSALGIADMAGNVWEWTASKFLPYPDFRAFPYDGYSKDHMQGEHYCCRGGSWATADPILRCSFRNWYVPTYRQGFLGLRCAK